MGEKVGMTLFDVIDPARAAGCEHRVDASLGALETVKKFRALFENRHVRRPPRVAHEIGAELFETRNDFPFEVASGRGPGGFGKRHAHGGRDLHDRHDVGVGEVVEEAVRFVLDGNGARRTDEGTLSALHAPIGVAPETAVKADARRAPRSFERDGGNALHLPADFDATKTANALVGRKDESGSRAVDRRAVGEAPREAREVEPRFFGNALEFAPPVARTARAALAVVGKKKFGLKATRAAHAFGTRVDAHPVRDRARAGGRKRRATACGRNVHEAHAARSRAVIERGEFAQGRNPHALAPGHFEHGFAFATGRGAAVQINLHEVLPGVGAGQCSSSALLPGIGRRVVSEKSR